METTTMKYELTKETKKIDLRTLYRIRALKNFGNVKEGDLGGWVEFEENLSQEGNCWIFGDAKVMGKARVSEDAEVGDHAIISGNAEVYGKSKIYGDSHIFEHANVYGLSKIYDNSKIYGNSEVFDYALVSGRSFILGNAKVHQYAQCNNVNVYGSADVGGDAHLFGIPAFINISSDSVIRRTEHILVVGPIGSRKSFTTFSRSIHGINVSCGCFEGTIKEFEKRVKETHGESLLAKDYLTAIKLAKSRLLRYEVTLSQTPN